MSPVEFKKRVCRPVEFKVKGHTYQHGANGGNVYVKGYAKPGEHEYAVFRKEGYEGVGGEPCPRGEGEGHGRPAGKPTSQAVPLNDSLVTLRHGDDLKWVQWSIIWIYHFRCIFYIRPAACHRVD